LKRLMSFERRETGRLIALLFVCVLLVAIIADEINNTGPVFEARGVVTEKGFDQQWQFFLLKTEKEKESLLIYVDGEDFEKISEGTRVFIKFREGRVTGTLLAIEVRPESP